MKVFILTVVLNIGFVGGLCAGVMAGQHMAYREAEQRRKGAFAHDGAFEWDGVEVVLFDVALKDLPPMCIPEEDRLLGQARELLEQTAPEEDTNTN